MSIPTFKVVSRRVLGPAVKKRQRRDWSPVITALEAGKVLLFPDDSLRDQDVKYLQLALARRGGKYRLHTKRTDNGRVIEAVPSGVVPR